MSQIWLLRTPAYSPCSLGETLLVPFKTQLELLQDFFSTFCFLCYSTEHIGLYNCFVFCFLFFSILLLHCGLIQLSSFFLLSFEICAYYLVVLKRYMGFELQITFSINFLSFENQVYLINKTEFSIFSNMNTVTSYIRELIDN